MIPEAPGVGTRITGLVASVSAQIEDDVDFGCSEAGVIMLQP